MPAYPAPKTDAEAEVTMHVTRTDSAWLAFSKRAYSHAWLTERGYPSKLPDHLRPAAERVYPRVVDAVGLSVRAGSPDRAPLAQAIQGAMEIAVHEMYADGVRDPVRVREHMQAARRATLRRA